MQDQKRSRCSITVHRRDQQGEGRHCGAGHTPSSHSVLTADAGEECQAGAEPRRGRALASQPPGQRNREDPARLAGGNARGTRAHMGVHTRRMTSGSGARGRMSAQHLRPRTRAVACFLFLKLLSSFFNMKFTALIPEAKVVLFVLNKSKIWVHIQKPGSDCA